MQRTTSRFVFRQFQLEHGNGVWKVGTDSVLLGSWCRVGSASCAVDLGTGSGIIPLMLAQRNPALLIDAIDIIPESVALARENVLKSPWQRRINVYEMDLLEPVQLSARSYDLVICNPPYFPFGPAAHEGKRRAARQGIGFTLWDVPSVASQLLKPGGTLHVVIPSQSQYHFIEKANTYKLYVQRRLGIKHHEGSEESIALFEFGHLLVRPDNNTLVLYAGDRPTQEFITLCGDFISI